MTSYLSLEPSWDDDVGLRFTDEPDFNTHTHTKANLLGVTGFENRTVTCLDKLFSTSVGPLTISPEPAAKIEHNLWIQKVPLSVPKMHLNRTSNSKNQNISRLLKNLKTNLSQ